MALGKDSKAYKSIAKHCSDLALGTVVSIDPSIGSGKGGSLPGYAVYEAGELVKSGVFEIQESTDVPWRLQSLTDHLFCLYEEHRPDVLVYEDIPAQNHGGNAVGHASLLKAVGAILSVPGPDGFVGIMPVSWKKLVRPGYVKGDEADAIEIGWICIQEARRILDGTAQAGAKGKRKSPA